MVIHLQNASIKENTQEHKAIKRDTAKSGCVVWLNPATLIKIRALCKEIHFQEQGLVRCLTYISQTEQWWHRSGFITWQRSQNLIAEDMKIKKISCPCLHPIACLTGKHWHSQHSVKRLYLCSCCGNVHNHDRWLRHHSYCPHYCQLHLVPRTSWLSTCEDGKFLGDINKNLLLNLWSLFHLILLFISVWQLKLEHRKCLANIFCTKKPKPVIGERSGFLQCDIFKTVENVVNTLE